MDQDVIYALEVMWKGMLSIFIVIFVLTLVVVLLTKITNSPSFKKSKDNV